MSILATIEQLEEAVAAVLDAIGQHGVPSRRLQSAVVEALLDELTASDLDELPEDGIEQLVIRVLERVYPQWTGAYRREIAERLGELLTLTEEFYGTLDISTSGLRARVQRSEQVRSLTRSLEEGMRHINDNLRERTITSITDQLRVGGPDLGALRATLERDTEITAFQANVQSKAALGAYNQTFRNAVAARAGLEHLYYYGGLQRNTRPFCRISRNRVYTREQVEKMDNAQLNPVSVHRGGWNCIHSWLPVSLDLHEELRPLLVQATYPVEIQLDRIGRRVIKVFAEEDRVARLEEQLPLERQGYVQFLDADTPPGYVAIHRTWLTAYTRGDSRSARRRRLERVREVALRLANQGHVVRLTTLEEGDLVVDGTPGRLEDFD